MDNVTYYHHSMYSISTGSHIQSVQNRGRTHDLVHKIYSEVALSLSIPFPKRYGYAYPKITIEAEKRFSYQHQYWYTVTSDSPVIIANYKHSLMVTMDRLSEFSAWEMPGTTLEQRLDARDAFIFQQATLYFMPPPDCTSLEAISENFIVTGRHYIE